MRHRRIEPILLAATVSCGSRSQPLDAIKPDAPMEAAVPPILGCAPPPIDVYAPGLVKEGYYGRLGFDLVESRPAPPQRGTNTFIVQVRDASGPTFVNLAVIPWYGRSTHSLLPTITFDAASTTYTVDPVYLFSVGRWQISMDAYPAGSDAGPLLDSAQFYFCVVSD
jgi:hypothetical protein